ncbi:TonB-dependent receptor [Massilia arenosa]|uniref:TonB-dependent receptor n=1 Tax=Zemynaea arenosa TaxID=2561931 RepID=A0A4Y9S2N4_9BURK|nr:TonB-dependent receptor [Massilia arenosa]TFW15563.1 TonB-dependent receptor [Massilia arenosa]
MHTKPNPRKQLLALTITSLFAGSALAQATPPTDDNTVVVTGTRVPNRTVLDTAAPVDVISADTLHNVGNTELNQSLSVALPSLNFPRPGLTDGTDTIRPATLRGMGPDQTLVLVNSKRRHSASLVNVNGSVGRGSAAVDLNTIPSSIVKSIEVLRDGAAAQYGSDAIAGVINVRLRTDRSGGEVTGSYGLRVTNYAFDTAAPPAGATWTPQKERSRRDGQTGTFSLWKGLPLGENGFLTLAAEYKDQAHTERSGYDMRSLYPKVGTAFDPRENTINRFDTWYGEPEMQQSTFFANAGMNLEGGAKAYGWASYQRRDSQSAANFRAPNNAGNVLAIWPDGFIPLIAPVVDDYSATGGVSWTMGDWDLDASLGFGTNKMAFNVINTVNASLGTASKTSFYAGGFQYGQAVANLTATRAYPMASLSSPLNVSLGAEARRERYNLFAGEPDSWRNGGVLSAAGAPLGSGSQGFPGYRPANETNLYRSAIGLFADFEANVTKQLLASFALRAEHYTDFGSNLSGKLAARYDFTPNFGLRGSVQNGFRAPSPQQQGFTATSTNFINGVPFEITTFKPNDPVARALGAKDLEAEKSVNISLGAVARVGKGSLTIDAYRINVKNRIVLSETLQQSNVIAFLQQQGFQGIGGARFFINGVDTRAQGVDIVGNWPFALDNAGKLDLTLAANFSDIKVTKVPTTNQLSALNPAPVLFARQNVLIFEEAQPKNKFSANANWTKDAWGATLRATRYGKTLSPGTSAALDWPMSAKTLVDLEGRYKFNKSLTLAIGAENLFDQYSDPFPPALNTNGGPVWSNYSPFGRGGRYVYGRASYAF